MSDLPIIFSAPMIRALLDNRKTMTRRLAWRVVRKDMTFKGEAHNLPTAIAHTEWKKVQVGDRLWVREAWRVSVKQDKRKPRELTPRTMSVMFEAGGSIANQNSPNDWRPDNWPVQGERPTWAGRYRHARFLPRWASRLTLAVTAIRIERLQDISEEDAKAEGLGLTNQPARISFICLWDNLHGAGAWAANPEVIAITFRPTLANIDAVPKSEAA